MVLCILSCKHILSFLFKKKAYSESSHFSEIVNFSFADQSERWFCFKISFYLVYNCEFVTGHWYLGSGVVLGCIDS